MPIETAVYVEDLNSSNPPSSDKRKEGDDHLRLTKAVLLRTFQRTQPSFTTTGTSTAYVLTTGHAGATLKPGGVYAFKLHTGTGANPTLNIDALGAVALRKPTPSGYTNVASGDYPTDAHLFAVYTGSTFDILSTPHTLNAFVNPTLNGNVTVGGNLDVDGSITQIGNDSNFAITLGGGGPVFTMDAGGSNYSYSRAGSQHEWRVANTLVAGLSATRLTLGTSVFIDGPGGTLTAAGNFASIGSISPGNLGNYFYTDDGTNPTENYDVNDSVVFTRASDAWDYSSGGTFRWRFGGTGGSLGWMMSTTDQSLEDNASGQGVHVNHGSGTSPWITLARTDTSLFLNKTAAGSGGFIDFRVQGVSQGSVSTSDGVQVSYNTFLGCHWSQWGTGHAPADPVLKGTVLATVRERCEWFDIVGQVWVEEPGRVEYASAEEIIAGAKAVRRIRGKRTLVEKRQLYRGEVPVREGDTIEWEWEGQKVQCRIEKQENTNLYKVKVATEADAKRLYGTYGGLDPDGDILVEAVGLGVCRIAPGVVVEDGDLLTISEVPGCAKVQADDIPRRSTIGRAVGYSDEPLKRFPDGSLLMACEFGK